MLADPRAASLVTNFAFQWLKMRGLDEIEPDAIVFPNFDDDLREAIPQRDGAVRRAASFARTAACSTC